MRVQSSHLDLVDSGEEGALELGLLLPPDITLLTEGVVELGEGAGQRVDAGLYAGLHLAHVKGEALLHGLKGDG